MKVADLYIRVSTDEQADKGFSQRDQEERLKKFCESKGMLIRKIIFEDHSAKTFIRPEWEKYLAFLKRSKGKGDLVLFTKWDRFSRNAPDAYNMIATLRGLRIEPQAIEQPLDMNVPENKMMLAIYLTAPEIENDRRGLNTFYGIRRARKEGRWPGLAPLGYINRTSADGRKYVMPNAKQADLMKAAFKEIAQGVFSVKQIYKRAVENGLKCGKSNFFHAIRNPFYMGIIQVPKYQDEEAFEVKGIHEPLITAKLFYEVQDSIDGRKDKTVKAKIYSMNDLPLKGFIKCQKCGRVLCGSASKGRNTYYHYYHCSSECGSRFTAKQVNEEFELLLSELRLSIPAAKILRTAIIDRFGDSATETKADVIQLTKQINDLTVKSTRARNLLLAGDIDGNDFKEIKSECEKGIRIAEERLNDITSSKYNSTRLEAIVDRAFNTLSEVDRIYKDADNQQKRKLIGSMFVEKFTFENLQHRTAKMAECLEYIFLINRKLETKKMGQKNLKNSLSHQG